MNRRISTPLPRPALLDATRARPAGTARADDDRFEHALALMQDSCWRDAFDALAELADEGHAQAARLALLLVQRGARLFGGSYPASGSRREAWMRASA